MGEGICYLECLSSFLDDGALNHVGEDLGLTLPKPPKPGRPFPAPQAREYR